MTPSRRFSCLLLALSLMACSEGAPQPAPAPTSKAPANGDSRGSDRTNGPPAAQVRLDGPQSARAASQDAPDPELAADLEKGGDVMIGRRDLAGALARYARSVAVTRKLHEASPEDTSLLAALTSRIEKAAYTCRLAGRTDEAVVLYRQHVEVAQRLAGRGEEHAAAGSAALQSLQILGDLLLQAGKPGEALSNFRAAHERLERAADHVKQTAAHRRNESVALGRIGFALQKLAQFDEARAALTRAAEIAAEIAAEPTDARDPTLMLEHASALTGLAAMEVAADAPDAARTHLSASLAIHRKLAAEATFRGSPQILHGLSVAAAQLARVELKRQELGAARELVTESLRALDAVIPHASNPVAAAREKVTRLELSSDIARAAKDWKLATEQRAEALALLEDLTQGSGGAAALWMQCARAHRELATLHGAALSDDPETDEARKSHVDGVSAHRARALLAAQRAAEKDGALKDWAAEFARTVSGEGAPDQGRPTTD